MEPPRLRLAFTEWPPYTSTALEGGGCLARLVSEAVAARGGAVETIALPWPEALARAQAGAVDAAFPGYASEERSARFLLSEPLFGGELCLFLRGDRPRPPGARLRVAVTEGYVNGPAIDADPAFEGIVVPDDRTGLERLLRGEVEAAALDRFVGRHHLRHSLASRAESVELVERPVGHFGLHVLFSRARPDAAGKRAFLDAALHAARAQERLTEALRGSG